MSAMGNGTLTTTALSTLWSKCPLYCFGSVQFRVKVTRLLISITAETFATTIENVHSAVENVNDPLRITGDRSVVAFPNYTACYG
ncbi:5168_t:CDS:2 [Paraglomus brasilianum]|uniref:5168_t:CDS:1 n=1 Tax=Paraglomus brasilianum TaxID=144538 RepID=A0A9N8Z953_9GLOM|nr:5168_t:CDS:2 [Paraglomus brasilianum]